MIVIVDYGLGNLRSILKKFEMLKIPATISSDKDTIKSADKLILPGVGNFAQGMKNLHDRQLIDVLNKKVITEKTPILGICLGMQLFCQHSQEGNVSGLSWINANVIKFDFPNQSTLRVPHVGWNQVSTTKKDPLLSNIPNRTRFYFTHSYYVISKNTSLILTTTDYGNDFISSIHQDNIYGTQYHPEKSHLIGLNIFKNFSNLT